MNAFSGKLQPLVDNSDSDSDMSYLTKKSISTKISRISKKTSIGSKSSHIRNNLHIKPKLIKQEIGEYYREDNSDLDSDLDSDLGSDEFDSDVSDIDEEYLKAYDCTVDESTGIYLFNGILLNTKEKIAANIQLYKNLNPDTLMFEPIISSTLTAKGLLRNVDFQHESIISKMTLPTDIKIVKIGCNEEEIYIYPNNYVDYNIIHIIAIIKNSKNNNFRTRIECNCQNLLEHADYILDIYYKIKNYISVIKATDIVRQIDKYLSTLKNRNKVLLDRIIKIFKRINSFIFHPYLFDLETLNGIKYLLKELEHNSEFEKNTCIKDLKTAFIHITELVIFFKEYIGKCICILQPYNPIDKIPMKIVSEDTKKSPNKKKLTIKKYTRKNIIGCRKYFSSQITFEIYGALIHKVYKIKIFRNGNFQAPGIKTPQMLDIIEPLTSLVNYLSLQFGNTIYVEYIISVMRNYFSRINSNPFVSQIKDYNGRAKVLGTHIYLDKLDEFCRKEKNSTYMMPDDALSLYNNLANIFSNNVTNIIWDYLAVSTIKIAGISNNSEKSRGLLLKFDRPLPNKPNKKMTIKILSIGKINFDGCNSVIEVEELYYWLHNIFRLHKDELLFDSSKFTYQLSEDDDGYESIYE